MEKMFFILQCFTYILEVAALALAVLFYGILDSRYYESIRLMRRDRFYVAAALLLSALFLSVGLINDNALREAFVFHGIFNFAMIALVFTLSKKFVKTKLKYKKQWVAAVVCEIFMWASTALAFIFAVFWFSVYLE